MGGAVGALASFPLSSVFLPGRCRDVRPTAQFLFFVSPKKRNQKKGDPGVCDPAAAQRGTLRCSRQSGSAQTRLTPQTCADLHPPAAALLGTATREWGAECRRPVRLRIFRLLGLGFRVPLWLCRGAQERADQEGRMSEPAGRVCGPPARSEHRRLPRRSRGHRHQGRLFFGDFLLAKQKKVTALPGAYPGTNHACSARTLRKSTP